MGQLNLLDHYWNYSNSKVYGFLQKCLISSRILEYLRKYKCTRFVEVPSCLKLKEDYLECLNSFFNVDFSFEPTRGEKTLGKIKESFYDPHYTSLKESLELDFDTSIIVWHLATSVCYHQEVPCTDPYVCIEERKSGKYLSDYMMYLLALQPALLLPERYRNFWLDDACHELKGFFSKASNMDHAFNLLLNQNDDSEESIPLKFLRKHVSKLVTALNSVERHLKWKMMKEIWIEMLLYAAHSSQHVNHVKQLGQYGREFLTLIKFMGESCFIEKMLEEVV